MQSFKFKLDKAIVALKMLIQAYGGEVDLHKLFKTLYFAEQKHLVKYGRVIIGDRYIAMKNGPVPSNLYDLAKYIRGEKTYLTNNNESELKKMFQIYNKFKIKVIDNSYDKTVLSQSDVECIEESFKENKDLDFKQLSEKSHDKAWKNADSNNEISTISIARAGGAKDGFIKYIELNIENENLTFDAQLS